MRLQEGWTLDQSNHGQTGFTSENRYTYCMIDYVCGFVTATSQRRKYRETMNACLEMFVILCIPHTIYGALGSPHNAQNWRDYLRPTSQGLPEGLQ